MRIRTLLLIDPDTDSRSTIAEMLSAAGHDVVEAEDALQAKTCLAERKFDAVILDDEVPGSWTDAVRMIQRSAPGVGVVVLATRATKIIPGGPVEFLLKPTRDLSSTVSRLFSRRPAPASIG